MAEETPVPISIEAKRSAWLRLWKGSVRVHYTFGIVGVGAAALAAAIGGEAGQILSVVAAVSTAVLGFVQPERKYLKFVRAWRIIDLAIIKFQLGKGSMDELIAAAERGETVITEFEATEPHPPDRE
jgi:hypothetical protein